MTLSRANGVRARAVTIQKPFAVFTGRALAQAKTPVTTGYSICPAPSRITSCPARSTACTTAPW